MKTLSLIFSGIALAILFVACGGGGGSSGGGSSTATITVTLPPMVIAKSTDGTSGAVDTAATISVTFNKDIDPLSITSATFTISGVSGSVSYNAATKTATFTPSGALAYSTKYTATITTGVKDPAGNAMASAFTWSFTTKQNPLPPAPTYLMGGAIQGNPLHPQTIVVTTLAGSGTIGAIDATGTAASFYNPFGITTDGINLFVADAWNSKIRKIVIATGAVTTLAGSGVSGVAIDATGTAARFDHPSGVTTDGTNLYVADTGNNLIRKVVIATGAVTTLAGSGTQGSADGTGTAASFKLPSAITTDGTNLYVADSNNSKIRKVVIATGVVTTLAGSGAVGSADGTGTAASFNYPYGITTDGTNLYVADTNNNKIRKIVIATGGVTTLAGINSGGSADGTGTSASFNVPTGITMDGTNLYVTDAMNSKIRKIDIATSAVTTTASINYSYGITTDGTNLYVADTNSNKILKISHNIIIAAPSSSPSGVTATAWDGWATMSWNDVADATSYNLYCTTGASVTTATGSKIANIASPYQLTHVWTASSTGLSNGTTYSCLVTASNDYGESAPSSPVVFIPAATHNVSVSLSSTNNGSGSVTSAPVGISCGSTCTATVTNGATITLAAAPASGSTFTGWSGACSGTGACTITLDSDKTVTAAFQGTSTPPPPSGTYYWANWSCGTSSQCAALMGGSSGSTGPMCTLNDCNAWKSIYFAGAACSTTATYTIHTSPMANGVCAVNGVDF